MSAALFWDVDTQVDFMHADGKLYVPGSVEIIPALERLTQHAHKQGTRIIASADDHVPGHRELSATPDFLTTFPDHCMRGTPGQAKIRETTLRDHMTIDPTPRDDAALADEVRRHAGDILFLKHWFDVFTNPNVVPVVAALAPERIVLYGVALDVCNRYAIEGLLERFPAIDIALVIDATRAIDATRSATLLADWSARGVTLTTTDEVLAA
jgi:nicotinamidase/pyrazinamidase